MTDHSYEEGLRDGKIKALEEMVTRHDERLDKHENRIGTLEKVAYSLIGAIALMQFAVPVLQRFLG